MAGKVKAIGDKAQRGGPGALATKMKAKKPMTGGGTGKKKGDKGKGGKKGKKGRKKRKKKGPRCPIKRRKKAIKRKCYSMTDPNALLNSYYAMHGVVELLKFRKFKWKKKKKLDH